MELISDCEWPFKSKVSYFLLKPFFGKVSVATGVCYGCCLAEEQSKMVQTKRTLSSFREEEKEMILLVQTLFGSSSF